MPIVTAQNNEFRNKVVFEDSDTTRPRQSTSKAHRPPTPELNTWESVMSPSTTQLLSCVYEAVKDLEEAYGSADQGVVDAKRVLIACLSSVRVIETPQEAQLFTSAHQLSKN